MSAPREHLPWVDLLRVAACFAVVFSHCCDPFVAQFDADPRSFVTGVMAGSLMRPCVPLFVMISGMLLLPLHTDMRTFYRRRIGRIAWPLLFWSVVLPVAFCLYLNYVSPASANPSVVGDHTWAGTANKLLCLIFNFNFDTTPLWYLYMLAGLYLVLPVFGSWLERAERRDVRLFLRVWGLTLLLPYVEIAAPLLGYEGNYGNMGLLGVCDWNKFGTFYYVSGFIGYAVLAFYLKKYPPQWSRRKMWGICAPMFLTGYLITSLGYLFMQRCYPGNYAYLEIVWYFAGINVFLMTFPVFLLASRMRPAPRPRLAHLAPLTFGIYLCHFIFVQAAYDLFDLSPLPPAVRIPLMAATAFCVSASVVWVMRRVGVTRRLVA